jgi:hypothetical protein
MTFMKEAASDMLSDSDHHPPFDLTEESSRRRGGHEASSIARQVESDDINEEKNTGQVDSPDDSDVENEVWTSSSDE